MRHLRRSCHGPCPLSTLLRVSAEAGARVARNVRLADMTNESYNVPAVPVADARRIEVVANSLPSWHGSQLAMDAPHAARRRPTPAHVDPGCALVAARAASGIRHTTQSWRAPDAAAWLLSASRLVDGSALRRCSSCACSQTTKPPPSPWRCCPPTPPLCWSCRPRRPSATDPCRSRIGPRRFAWDEP